jgi:ATPase family protein associated with various cellular activities (AAA)
MELKQEKFSGVTFESHRLGGLVWANRVIAALEDRVAGYSIHRELRFAARIEMEVLMDAIALDPAWRVHRNGSSEAVIDGDGLFVFVYASRKADYSSWFFYIYGTDVSRVEDAKERLLAKAGSTLVTEPMFSIDWHFVTCRGSLENAAIEELATDVLHDAAYPEIPGGVTHFVGRYLDAAETVLVLQGPPGTGKTRLIRAILGAMSQRKGEPARALYTGDMRALQSDEAFVKFITGDHDAFVVEDADHLMKPRADGNEHLHRFLTIADGVVRAQGRKIVFSTNLPNVGDLDEALIRPGRCFARVNARALTDEEAKHLAVEIAAGDVEKLCRIPAALSAGKKRGHSLAEVYQAMQ